ncbi:hypothetical protein QJQ45_014180 [Haematococcus lacustris]|nr:hypothetical protein QJQ45_014180 [Haematococcus lacustris]
MAPAAPRSSWLVAALLLVLAATANASVVNTHRRTAGRVLLQQAGTVITDACPVNTTTTALNLTAIRTSCNVNSTSFCDACSCSLFQVFTPALQAAGVFSSSALENSTRAVEAGTSVITSCITGFLSQFITAGVNVQSLVALGECQYPADVVPQCLVDQISSILASENTTLPATNATAAPGSAPATNPASPPVTSASGPGEYTPDSGLNSDVTGAINSTRPGGMTGGSSGGSTTPATGPSTSGGLSPAAGAPGTTSPAPAPVTASSSSSSMPMWLAATMAMAAASLLL